MLAEDAPNPPNPPKAGVLLGCPNAGVLCEPNSEDEEATAGTMANGLGVLAPNADEEAAPKIPSGARGSQQITGNRGCLRLNIEQQARASSLWERTPTWL